MADQIVTLTEDTDTKQPFNQITWAWTSATDGSVSSQTAGSFTSKEISMITDPGATAPTADYDITITDENGVDVMLATGTDRHTTATEYVKAANTGVVYKSRLTLTIAAAGAEKTGTVYLWL